MLATALLAVALVVLTGGLFVVALVLFAPALLLVGAALWLVLRLTTDFVVPAMIVEGTGVVGGWRSFWPELRANWRQYGVYAITRFVLGAVGGVVAAIGFAAAAVVLAIPFGIVGVPVTVLLVQVLGLTLLGVAFGAAVVVLFALSVLVAGTTFVQVPIQTYLRYYSLLVLGAITPAYDLVADVRAVIGGEPENDRG